MDNWTQNLPPPVNEPTLDYRPDSPETKALKAQLKSMASSELEIPVVIDGKELRTGNTAEVRQPHNHRSKLGTVHLASAKEVKAAIDGALKAQKEWADMPAADRCGIFLKAAELLSQKYRWTLNGATMLGQSKTCHQAEIDSACELIDFLRFNVHFYEQLLAQQPLSGKGMWNRLQYRPLEGFVFAVSPFNFTAIGGNLPTSVALMGNVVLWKPATTAVYSNYHFLKILHEAGLPPGVIQFVPGGGEEVASAVLRDRNLAGIHFTGSTGVFQGMWKTVGENIAGYRTYPRLVGETGGKDFVFAHPSADPAVVATALTRGAFEYQGQKCSAASRAYIPKSLWPKVKEKLLSDLSSIKMGDVSDFSNFVSAVIDKKAFGRIKGYIDEAKKSSQVTVLAGGECDDSVGYFVQPTVLETKDPKYRTMCEEIFGPVLTLHVYDDSQLDEMLKIVDETSPYALTGAILAQDRRAIVKMTQALTNAAGNFYINNKPTGAVVGQQPFGGARASGTNDKAGSLLNLIRWTSVRTVSETFTPPSDFRYPWLDADPKSRGQ
jgi:1-pyrroline-5-carboxylate dehydrogenase